ncbi:hypothetical protein QEN19_000496 [Hanseniaspora menglaensis]
MSTVLLEKLKELYDFVMLVENGIIDDNIMNMFNKLPDRSEVPDYYQTIVKPMSFQKIQRSLKHYDTAQALIADFCQITYNCKFYNKEGSVYYMSADKLEKAIKDLMIPKAKIIFGDESLKWVDFDSIEAENTSLGSAAPKSTSDQHANVNEKADLCSEDGTKAAASTLATNNIQSNVGTATNSKGVDNGDGIFIAADGKQYITSPDVTKTFTKIPVGIRDKYPKYVQDRILVYEAQQHLGSSEHQARKKGRPTIRPLLESRYLQFLNDEKILENPLLDHKAPFIFNGSVKTFEQVKFNIKRGFFISVEELMMGLKEVCEYQVNHALQQNQGAIKIFTNNILDKAFMFFSDFHKLREDNDKITVDRIQYNDIVYEIGSFVLLKNTVDETRPIPAQIFQIWKEGNDGSIWMTCSWYLRPEQTIHRADRLFYKNEVVKSTQSRIHRIEDILGACSVVHFTRFVRAEPLDAIKPMFICEYRYNDSSYKFNKIRTWKGAVPDAVKDLEEYDVPLPQPRFLKKFDSPLKHLLDSNLSLNSTSPPEYLPTLQSTKESEQPSLGNVYRDCVVERDELGEYSTSLKYTQRHLILPQHFHLIPPNIRFDPQTESFIDTTNVLNSFVLSIYGTGVQNFNTPSLDHLNRSAGVGLQPAHNSSARLATLNNFGTGSKSAAINLANGDMNAVTGSMSNIHSRSAMTKALLNAAEKKKSKYNKISNQKAGSQSPQTATKTASQAVKTEGITTKSHYLDVLLTKNRLTKNVPSFLGDDSVIDNDHKYLVMEQQAFILNEPILEHIEGFRRTTSEINHRIENVVEKYNSTVPNSNEQVILYNNSNLKNETEKKLQDIKISELRKKAEEDAIAASLEDQDLNSDDEIDNLYLTKNERKRRNSEMSSDGSFIDSELSESEIIERRAFKKLQKLDSKETEEDELMRKYCRMVDGAKKGDIIWFKGMGANITKRIIDPKNPLDNAGVGPSLEYLHYRLQKEKNIAE